MKMKMKRNLAPFFAKILCLLVIALVISELHGEEIKEDDNNLNKAINNDVSEQEYVFDETPVINSKSLKIKKSVSEKRNDAKTSEEENVEEFMAKLKKIYHSSMNKKTKPSDDRTNLKELVKEYSSKLKNMYVVNSRTR
jgi:hypothetical protein